MAFQILEISDKFSVVVEESDTEYKPLILRGSALYNPEDNFRPVDAKPNQKSLDNSLRDEARQALRFAKKKWEQSKSESGGSFTQATQSTQQTERVVIRQDSVVERAFGEALAKISLDQCVKELIPKLDEYIEKHYGVLPKLVEIKIDDQVTKIEGVIHEKFETVLKLAKCNIPVFLTGPAGCGKNVICKQVADSLELPFFFSNAVTQEYKLTGFIDANGVYQETQFYKAFTDGGVFMLDEIDASTPEVLVILNAAIANGYFDFPKGQRHAHDNFRLVAAGNTYGSGADIEYTGRYQLDAASLDRFAIIEVDYSKAIEDAIAGTSTELLAFIRDFRNAVRQAQVKFIVSYRSLQRVKKMIDSGFSVEESLQIGLIRGLAKDDALMIANNVKSESDFAKTLRKMLK